MADGLAGADVHERRAEALMALAQRVAGGNDVRLLCWCYPRRCHAMGIAFQVRRLAARVRRAAAVGGGGR